MRNFFSAREKMLYLDATKYAMAEKNGLLYRLIQAALLVVGIMIFVRFLPLLLRFLLPALALVLLGAIVYLAWQQVDKARQKRALAGTTEGRILARIDFCKEQTAQNQEELVHIRENIEDLHRQLQAVEGLTPNKRQGLQRLAREFEAELQLRQAKAAFFELALKKLQNVLRNSQISQTLDAKEEELRRLKETRYDDLASMEELRSDLETETLYLDTIDELSLKLDSSTSLENAVKLRNELEEMTRDLES
jgi:hypothetical protein